VNEERAARLTGVPLETLHRISRESHIGHHEYRGQVDETFFTYAELRRICQLATAQVH
jgi:hypothetical protein